MSAGLRSTVLNVPGLVPRLWTIDIFSCNLLVWYFSHRGWMTESSRNWKEKPMQKRTSLNQINLVLDHIKKLSKIKRKERRSKNHKNLSERKLVDWLKTISGSVKKSSLPVTEMPKSINKYRYFSEWVKLIGKNSVKCLINSKKAKSQILVSGKDFRTCSNIRWILHAECCRLKIVFSFE